jgi:hypothetical protein
MRPFRQATQVQLANGIPLFLTQLGRTLDAEQHGRPMESLRISGAAGGRLSTSSEIGLGAAEHGKQLSSLGYTVDQVVHDYGDLCQAITEMAVQEHAPIEVEEFRTLNRCLDNAIATAVLAFSTQGELQKPPQDPAAAGGADMLLHGMRSSLATAIYAATAIELGNLPMSGSTGFILKSSLATIRSQLEAASPPEPAS